jgi:tRNA pseudouridine13 synthase
MPYLTADLPGVGGRIKVNPADFRVAEIPLYAPSGYGEHTYVRIEKTGIPTFEAVRRIARALHIDSRSIGYAGLKDAHAITEQTLSLGNVPPSLVEALDVPAVRVLSVDRHTNKLRVGHLRGNRFTVRIRDTGRIKDLDALSAAQAILDVLARYGVPNYYGEQRFGLRGDTHLLGRALVCKEDEAFVRRLVGSPPQEAGQGNRTESSSVRKARALFEAGDLQASLPLWPRHMQAERRAVQTLLDRPGQYHRVVRAIPSKMRSFYVSAYQSALFNRVLARRLLQAGDLGAVVSQESRAGDRVPHARHQALGTLLHGDLAYIHAKGAVFLVEDPAGEQARADRLEISPSGPLYGYKLTPARGVPGEMERRVLAEEGLELEDFRLRGLKFKGARRPLRFPLSETLVQEDGEGLVVSFALPPGCYATVVLREIVKDVQPGTSEPV